MSIRQRTKGILLYNLLMKEATRINRNLPEDRKLSIGERRQLISQKLYPKYKDVARSSIRLTPLREKLVKTIQRIPKKQGCDVLAIPPDTYQEIPYYEIEQFIESILPNCIFVRIDAGEYGQTNVFNTRDFNYYSLGIADITNQVNTLARRRNLHTSTIPIYKGRINLRHNKPNDGNPDSYFLEMILSETGRRPKLNLVIPHRKKTKKQIRQEGNIKQYIRERLKTMRNEKSAFKKIKKSIVSGITEMERVMKIREFSNEEKKKYKAAKYESLTKKIEALQSSGKITDAKRRRFLNQVNKAFGKTKNKNS